MTVPDPKHPLGEEHFLNIQPKSPLTQFRVLSSSPVAGHWREQINACLSVFPCEEAGDSSLTLCQAEQTVTSAAPHIQPLHTIFKNSYVLLLFKNFFYELQGFPQNGVWNHQQHC